MAWSGEFGELENYLRDFTNIGGDPPYDTNGILILMLALADNLRQCPSATADLPELAENINPEQAQFLERLAAWAREHQSNGSTERRLASGGSG